MRTSLRSAALLVTIAIISALALAQDAAPERIAWQTDLEAAWEVATAEGRPLLVEFR